MVGIISDGLVALTHSGFQLQNATDKAAGLLINADDNPMSIGDITTGRRLKMFLDSEGINYKEVPNKKAQKIFQVEGDDLVAFYKLVTDYHKRVKDIRLPHSSGFRSCAELAGRVLNNIFAQCLAHGFGSEVKPPHRYENGERFLAEFTQSLSERGINPDAAQSLAKLRLQSIRQTQMAQGA